MTVILPILKIFFTGSYLTYVFLLLFVFSIFFALFGGRLCRYK